MIEWLKSIFKRRTGYISYDKKKKAWVFPAF